MSIQLQCAKGKKPWVRGTLHGLLHPLFPTAHLALWQLGWKGGSLEVLTSPRSGGEYSKVAVNLGAQWQRQG